MKRSSQVVLLLMGATGVGATGYAMTPASSAQCAQPNARPAATGPAVAGPGGAALAPGAAAEPCPPRRSWSNSSGHRTWFSTTRDGGSRPIWTRRESTVKTTTSVPFRGSGPPRIAAITTTTTRGFGTIGHSMARASGS